MRRQNRRLFQYHFWSVFVFPRLIFPEWRLNHSTSLTDSLWQTPQSRRRMLAFPLHQDRWGSLIPSGEFRALIFSLHASNGGSRFETDRPRRRRSFKRSQTRVKFIRDGQPLTRHKNFVAFAGLVSPTVAKRAEEHAAWHGYWSYCEREQALLPQRYRDQASACALASDDIQRLGSS